MPVDYSSCTEDCVLTIYWLAFQNEQWQAYSTLMCLEAPLRFHFAGNGPLTSLVLRLQSTASR
jgi:hypothetical protein